MNLQQIIIRGLKRDPHCKKKLDQLHAVDIQNPPAKLPFKLHMFAYVEFLAQSLKVGVTKAASWDFLHVNCRQLTEKAGSPSFSQSVLNFHFLNNNFLHNQLKKILVQNICRKNVSTMDMGKIEEIQVKKLYNESFWALYSCYILSLRLTLIAVVDISNTSQEFIYGSLKETPLAFKPNSSSHRIEAFSILIESNNQILSLLLYNCHMHIQHAMHWLGFISSAFKIPGFFLFLSINRHSDRCNDLKLWRKKSRAQFKLLKMSKKIINITTSLGGSVVIFIILICFYQLYNLNCLLCLLSSDSLFLISVVSSLYFLLTCACCSQVAIQTPHVCICRCFAQSLCSLKSDCASKLASWEFLHTQCQKAFIWVLDSSALFGGQHPDFPLVGLLQANTLLKKTTMQRTSRCNKNNKIISDSESAHRTTLTPLQNTRNINTFQDNQPQTLKEQINLRIRTGFQHTKSSGTRLNPPHLTQRDGRGSQIVAPFNASTTPEHLHIPRTQGAVHRYKYISSSSHSNHHRIFIPHFYQIFLRIRSLVPRFYHHNRYCHSHNYEKLRVPFPPFPFLSVTTTPQ
ncbi:hypothetical protein VP01_9g3 [Puccinia sorghi]|uniref:Uncharacterized protein n=1 Tax=Puccinia sorghi TaxID=27349 RepID=A0A0L6U753_9BASI|nr:hypothetical protein VP01_9g3 [Puccinia sorghi]